MVCRNGEGTLQTNVSAKDSSECVNQMEEKKAGNIMVSNERLKKAYYQTGSAF